ncbi:MAG TPA: anaerobic glycerol-3-phosphate dehydrogenase subunit GlpA [Thermodesulfobacteriota bacterium]|nr:anaerobic glycerol-3-phosphate dehydrogenase subunit GlpA [Thermodesulfobacteriota bacterium]
MKTEVVVIGGGATGAGVLRDLALRGIDAVLVEKNELTSGSSGRNHGLLHSGARYAVKDPESARECIAENSILKRIAAPCIEDTGGYFVSLPQDPPEYPDDLLATCGEIGIPAQEIPPGEALRREPALSSHIRRAIRVPDAAIDPFRLIRSNVEDALKLGARFLPHTEVTSVKSDGRVLGVAAEDRRTGEHLEIECRFLVNAAGVWAGEIARMAGGSLPMVFSKGSLIVFNKRLVNIVINRCRLPSNGDILVPHGPALILGTTSYPTAEIEDPAADESEVNLLFEEGEKMAPDLNTTRAIRAYAGVRPLMGARESEEDSRTLSRDFLLFDHAAEGGTRGLFSIVGGKLTTYRLMAEKTVDAICREMGNAKACATAETPLPFPKDYSFHSPESRLRQICDPTLPPDERQVYCDCELVLKEEIRREAGKMDRTTLKEIQERTRAGMGPCQGGFCSSRIAAFLAESGKIDPADCLKTLKRFLEERWKGTRPVLWGPQLNEEQLIQGLYAEFYNLDHL